MFEAEIKFLADPGFTPPGEQLPHALYHDVYFDTPDGELTHSGRELRLRRTGDTAVLTAKARPFDRATNSKEEFETAVADAAATTALLAALGYVVRVAYAKHCRRFHDTAAGLALDITVVTVDFDCRTFVEIEHPAATQAAALAALPTIRAYAAGLGLVEACATAYTDLALAALAPQPSTTA